MWCAIGPKTRWTSTAYKDDVKRLEEAGATQVFAAEAAVASVIVDRVIGDLKRTSDPQSERFPVGDEGHQHRGTE